MRKKRVETERVNDSLFYTLLASLSSTQENTEKVESSIIEDSQVQDMGKTEEPSSCLVEV